MLCLCVLATGHLQGPGWELYDSHNTLSPMPLCLRVLRGGCPQGPAVALAHSISVLLESSQLPARQGTGICVWLGPSALGARSQTEWGTGRPGPHGDPHVCATHVWPGILAPSVPWCHHCGSQNEKAGARLGPTGMATVGATLKPTAEPQSQATMCPVHTVSPGPGSPPM